ncbi:MAG: hypothetical protein H7326_08785 [Bdellovibrionaceae bacterium]|nr:hypothetical protein [Pseudobdellovibrionaceae bacterium]
MLLCTFEALAAERRNFYSGARGLAMGGAQLATVNDETALLINPSALGKLRDFYGTILDPEVEATNSIGQMNRGSAITSPFAIDEVKKTLDISRAAYYHAKAQVFPSLVMKNFGIGLYGNYLLDGEMNAAGTNMNMYYRSDLALIAGYNLSLFDGRVKVGVNAKMINRIELVNTTINPAGPLDLQSLGATEGTGLSTDAAIMLSAPWEWIPTITAVARDIGGNSFDTTHGMRMTTTNRPTALKQDVDVAVAIFPIHANRVRSTWTIEYRSLLTASEEDDKAKLIHAGAELNFSDMFFLRAGYNQRYYTGGLEYATERFQFQLSTYGEEIGTAAAPREDRRTAVKFAFRF